jgi:hypothetical protein
MGMTFPIIGAQSWIRFREMTAIDFKKKIFTMKRRVRRFLLFSLRALLSSWSIFASFRSGAARHEGSGGKPL